MASCSNGAKLQLNNTKCEVSTFSNDGAGNGWEPLVLLGGRQLNLNRTPKFLGVRYDRTLRFNEHIREVRQQMFRRLDLVCRLGGTKWGWRRTQLRRVYLALIRSAAEYAAPAWFP